MTTVRSIQRPDQLLPVKFWLDFNKTLWTHSPGSSRAIENRTGIAIFDRNGPYGDRSINCLGTFTRVHGAEYAMTPDSAIFEFPRAMKPESGYLLCTKGRILLEPGTFLSHRGSNVSSGIVRFAAEVRAACGVSKAAARFRPCYRVEAGARRFLLTYQLALLSSARHSWQVRAERLIHT